MKRNSIRTKVLAALIACLVLGVGGILALMNYSFERNSHVPARDDNPTFVVADKTTNSESIIRFDGELPAVPESGIVLERFRQADAVFVRGLFPIRDAAGNAVGAMFVVRDISSFYLAMQGTQNVLVEGVAPRETRAPPFARCTMPLFLLQLGDVRESVHEDAPELFEEPFELTDLVIRRDLDFSFVVAANDAHCDGAEVFQAPKWQA